MKPLMSTVSVVYSDSVETAVAKDRTAIEADLSNGSSGWEDGVLPSQLFWGYFVYAAVWEVRGEIEEGGGAVEDDLRGGTVPKKIFGGVAVGWYVPEEFPGCELYDFLYCNTVLFEGEQQQ
ncbi:uncharacterized protein MONOS_4913 [Monocercomonoides exilis]|uniref:uncharacterized protein n=1 Tax=Monocercomonoides exilis TaxID=2049356 RepID=UPI00355A6C6B|nr:hypothetical protein MONOS_4913 [Monocercomonoides exilis]|eukprot:MONOS_4913.1-p1 / transcript=MONOS_4913.1 / gene=MONOS_4913 / organism=Monocercomonoides_exilis_PA203 / gene_product=unspecified product / transcript_product=unspecified product / location=Mono_scaffold00137:80210-80686(-) / protein_length=121 / sequence_SO=supercontig / SO=protein_coding / is_pseudo=false